MVRSGPAIRTLAIVTAVFTSSIATAAHCPPAQRMCPPCMRTDPGPHPSADAGFYWICNWLDGCHHVCYDERVTYEVDVLLKLPENIFRGTCAEFNALLQSHGATDETGTNHENWAGYTYFRVYGRAPSWSESVNVTPEIGGVTSCITASGLMPNFSLPYTQDVMRWVPERPIDPACSRENMLFQQRAVDHEMEHVQRARAIVDQANAQPIAGFSPTVCRAATTQEEASRRARAAIRYEAINYLRGPANDLWNQIREELPAVSSN